MLSLLEHSPTAFQILTSCTRTLDDYWLAAAQTQNGQTNTGTCFFTTVATEPGYYRICMHARSLLSNTNKYFTEIIHCSGSSRVVTLVT